MYSVAFTKTELLNHSLFEIIWMEKELPLNQREKKLYQKDGKQFHYKGTMVGGTWSFFALHGQRILPL